MTKIEIKSNVGTKSAFTPKLKLKLKSKKYINLDLYSSSTKTLKNINPKVNHFPCSL